MGLFDDISLSPKVRDMVREQYPGAKEITFDGWQSKSLGCMLQSVVLADDHVVVGGERRPHFTGEIVFYRSAGERAEGSFEWLQFIAVYVDGRIVAVRHEPGHES